MRGRQLLSCGSLEASETIPAHEQDGAVRMRASESIGLRVASAKNESCSSRKLTVVPPRVSRMFLVGFKTSSDSVLGASDWTVRDARQRVAGGIE